MSVTTFIKNKFLGQELCIMLSDSEAETINYDQASASNREFFRGIVEEADDDVIVLNVDNHGILYICEHSVRCFWKPGFEYHKAILTSITRKMVGARR